MWIHTHPPDNPPPYTCADTVNEGWFNLRNSEMSVVSGDQGVSSAVQLRVQYISAPAAQRSHPTAPTVPAAPAPAPSAPAAAPTGDQYHNPVHSHDHTNGTVAGLGTEQPRAPKAPSAAGSAQAPAAPKAPSAAGSAQAPAAISGPRVVADMRSLRSLPQVDGVFCRHTFSKVLCPSLSSCLSLSLGTRSQKYSAPLSRPASLSLSLSLSLSASVSVVCVLQAHILKSTLWLALV